MVLASTGGEVYLERRPEAGIWGGLWSLPEIGDETVEDWCVRELGREHPLDSAVAPVVGRAGAGADGPPRSLPGPGP